MSMFDVAPHTHGLRLVERSVNGCRLLLNAEVLRDLEDAATKLSVITATSTAERAESDLSGRGMVERVSIGGTRLVVRLARRGGMVRHLSRDRYIRPFHGWDAARPFAELRTLANLRRHGVAVAEPAAAVVQPSLGGLLFRGAVVTVEVARARNLFELARDPAVSTEALEELARRAGVEAQSMLRAGVYHRDLHPGNVLVDSADAVVLIDFDGARSVRGDVGNSVAMLSARWTRAVVKHGLPLPLAAGFDRGVRSDER